MAPPSLSLPGLGSGSIDLTPANSVLNGAAGVLWRRLLPARKASAAWGPCSVPSQLPLLPRIRPSFGTPTTTNYRSTFFAAYPELEGTVVVHHAVPQRTLTLYPDAVTTSEINSLENLRGIPNEINSDVHLSQIARSWNQFYSQNPAADVTADMLLQKATEVDLKYGQQ